MVSSRRLGVAVGVLLLAVFVVSLEAKVYSNGGGGGKSITPVYDVPRSNGGKGASPPVRTNTNSGKGATATNSNNNNNNNNNNNINNNNNNNNNINNNNNNGKGSSTTTSTGIGNKGTNTNTNTQTLPSNTGLTSTSSSKSGLGASSVSNKPSNTNVNRNSNTQAGGKPNSNVNVNNNNANSPPNTDTQGVRKLDGASNPNKPQTSADGNANNANNANNGNANNGNANNGNANNGNANNNANNANDANANADAGNDANNPPAQPVSGPQRILTIGDSHSVGPFGGTLHAELTQGHSDWTSLVVGACGKRAIDYVRGGARNCGFRMNGQVSGSGQVATPTLTSLLSHQSFGGQGPTFVVVELGANGLQGTSQLAEQLQQRNIPCMWVNSPHVRRRTDAQMNEIDAGIRAAQSHCQMFDSRYTAPGRDYLRYAESGGDGYHYSTQSMRPLAQRWARDVIAAVNARLGGGSQQQPNNGGGNQGNQGDQGNTGDQGNQGNQGNPSNTDNQGNQDNSQQANMPSTVSSEDYGANDPGCTSDSSTRSVCEEQAVRHIRDAIRFFGYNPQFLPVVLSILRYESALNPLAENRNSHASGIGQFMPQFEAAFRTAFHSRVTNRVQQHPAAAQTPGYQNVQAMIQQCTNPTQRDNNPGRAQRLATQKSQGKCIWNIQYGVWLATSKLAQSSQRCSNPQGANRNVIMSQAAITDAQARELARSLYICWNSGRGHYDAIRRAQDTGDMSGVTGNGKPAWLRGRVQSTLNPRDRYLSGYRSRFPQ